MPAPSLCQACGRALGHPYVRAGRHAYHPACFCCAGCEQPLTQTFTEQKGRVWHVSCYQAQSGKVCTYCHHPLGESWVTFEKYPYHAACYDAYVRPECCHCGGAITGGYHSDDAGHWHVACYDQVNLEPCAICQQPLKGKYLFDPWGHKAHVKHGGQRTLSCGVCARLVSQATSQGGIQYGDGRVVCGICRLTEVTETTAIAQIKTYVLAQLRSVGFDYIPDYIAVNLADQHTLNQRLGAGRSANSHGYTKTIEKRVNGQLTREHSIFILHGLPRLVFSGVLAHELLHVWLNDRGIHHWPEREIEGFCNLGTALVYQNDDTPLAQVLLKRMEDDPSPVYGEGFRRQRARLQQLGWLAMIQAMQAPPSALYRLNAWIDRVI
ncbi:MAG: protein DA1 [Candidatus Sericytochromatia bacterium]